MKLRAVTVSRFLGRFRKAEPALREAVLDAAAEALLHELQYAGALETEISKHGSKRFVGSGNAADAEREFGTLEQNSSPWLAPVLPLALEPMRAAATRAAARAVSSSGNGRK